MARAGWSAQRKDLRLMAWGEQGHPGSGVAALPFWAGEGKA